MRLTKSIEDLLLKLKKKGKNIWLTKRSDNPYATHIPVLVGLGHVLDIRKVLEFGSGRHSTLTFLDRRVFPDLEKLDSFENNRSWFCAMDQLTEMDPRVSLTYVDGPMNSVVEHIPFQSYDLVFIDDSESVEQRTKTIKKAAKRYSLNNVIVVHDYEKIEYRVAIRDVTNCFRITALNPNTGVLWDNSILSKSYLRKLNALVREYRVTLALTDRMGWRNVIQTNLGSIEKRSS